MPTFEAWFADLLGQSKHEVKRLLNDEKAIRFLIAWSMFEGRCFEDSASEREIGELADRMVSLEGFSPACLSEAFAHFHARYQDKSRLRALLHKRKSDRLVSILNTQVADLSPADQTFLVMFVVFRFRNNIFHGNKGVASWLQYGEQIRLCTKVMQVVISHNELVRRRVAA